MKERIYWMLVNRVPEIRDKYLKKKQQSKNYFTLFMYLIWLNIQYYILMKRSIKSSERYGVDQEKILYHIDSESSLIKRESPELFAKKLMEYDIVSFDVFDTLIFRHFSNPTDLFYLVGMELKYPDFRRIRVEIEGKVRREKYLKEKNWEITFENIWDKMEKETGIPKEKGKQVEWKYEKRCCYANPYMLEVVNILKRNNKKIIAVSDMYFCKKSLIELLENCGYSKFEDYFVSCDYNKSKSNGSMYKIVLSKFGRNKSYVHIGDNEHSDKNQALKYNITPYLYENINDLGKKYRTEDMSVIIGSIYRSIVNSYIYNGLYNYSREYEYGFIYGGLFVTGYCKFIHQYAKLNKIDKILFLSRDGCILFKAYNIIYPEESKKINYVYWSRLAAMKMSANYYRYDYFRRFLYHKVDQGYNIKQILEPMDLNHMVNNLCYKLNIKPDTKLTSKNLDYVKEYLLNSWDEISDRYEEQLAAGKQYYNDILKDCDKAIAVDIGWVGSGAIMLDYLINNVWDINCDITGIIAGTNTYANAESDAGESLIINNKIISYLYSQNNNRDIWKFHDPSKKHNLYWELLLSAPEGSLRGFYMDKNGKYRCKFKDNKVNYKKIEEIHHGILDFVQAFLKVEDSIGSKLEISGRDAYAPMINICSKNNKKFMDSLEELLDEIHIG